MKSLVFLCGRSHIQLIKSKKSLNHDLESSQNAVRLMSAVQFTVQKTPREGAFLRYGFLEK